MEKVYRLLHWLDMAQALDYLQALTATSITEQILLQLCEAGQCRAYADVDGVQGNTWEGLESATAKGIHLVTSPVTAFGSGWEPKTLVTRGDIIGSAETEWFGELPPWKRGPIFQPSDIEALAATMNGVTESALEVEALRQELEQERALRGVVESELRERRAKDGREDLNAIRQQLSHSPAEFAAMRERAEKAERMAAALDKQLTELAEQQRLSDKAFKEMARQLRDLHDGQQPITQKGAQTGLTFPYATKELEAMRAAVAQYWEGYTPDKRQPTQKAVAITLGELLKLPLQGNGEPARKAITLATAIRPDTLPDA